MDISDTTISRFTALISSMLIRLGAYVFLRWPFPPLIIALLLVYVPSFFYSLWFTASYRVVADEVDVVITNDRDHSQALQDFDVRNAEKNGLEAVGDEIVVEETIVVEQRDPEIFKCLLTGLPSPSSLITNLVTLAINIALAAMVVDYTYRATVFYPSHDLSFARLGYVSDTTASILVREPATSHYPIDVSYRVSEDLIKATAWKSGGRSIRSLDNATDFTGQFFIDGLRPDTQYQYKTSNNHSGSFLTAPATGHISPRHGSFTFLHSSCLKNNFPYNALAHPLSNAGLKYLAAALKDIRAQFMLFLGDFIYIDVPRRHGFSTAEDYRREYRHVYASPDWPAASQDLPWIHVYDDHEIANDWDKNTTSYFSAANDPYEHYHTSVNPPVARLGKTYFQFTNGPASFFMLDTRRYRSPNDNTNGSDPKTGAPTKSMLGEQQLQDLLAWLRRSERPGVRWKIVVSSVPFTLNWQKGAQDTWRGYLGEREIILQAMWDVGAKGGTGVVILSGDRHEFAATAFHPPPTGKETISVAAPVGKLLQQAALLLGKDPKAGEALLTTHKQWPASAVVYEYSASPLNMFYLPIRTYKESSTSPDYTSDVCIKYIPDGNSKFGSVTISSTGDQSVLLYKLYIDGEERWSHTITTPFVTGQDNSIWG